MSKLRLTAMIAAIGLTLTGCQSTPKPEASPADKGGSNSGHFWDRNGTQSGPEAPYTSAGRDKSSPSAADVSGVLAGQLVDRFSGRPHTGLIRVTLAEEATTGAPIEAEANAQGYFNIQGLQPGKTYILTARSQDGGRLLVGEVQARPPQTVLLIRLSEDNRSVVTPPLPTPTKLHGSGGWGPPPATPGSGIGPPPGVADDAGWNPGGKAITPAGGVAVPGPPPQVAPPPEAPPPSTPSNANDPAAGVGVPVPGQPDPSSIATTPPKNPPVISVPTVPPTPPAPPSSFSNGSDMPVHPTAVPSATVTPGKLHNLALYDLDGQTWEFRRDLQPRTQLVLLDFWGSFCKPCLRSIPSLRAMQRAYGWYGLEVVGIACERDAKQGVPVIRSLQREMQINYRMLLDGNGVAQKQFAVRSLPTYVLVDRDGAIIWHGGSGELPEAERVIQRRLKAPE